MSPSTCEGSRHGPGALRGVVMTLCPPRGQRLSQRLRLYRWPCTPHERLARPWKCGQAPKVRGGPIAPARGRSGTGGFGSARRVPNGPGLTNAGPLGRCSSTRPPLCAPPPAPRPRFVSGPPRRLPLIAAHLAVAEQGWWARPQRGVGYFRQSLRWKSAAGGRARGRGQQIAPGTGPPPSTGRASRQRQGGGTLRGLGGTRLWLASKGSVRK